MAGAFLGAAVGAMASRAIAQIALGRSIGDTDLATVLFAIPGTIVGLAVVYAMGVREERAAGISV